MQVLLRSRWFWALHGAAFAPLATIVYWGWPGHRAPLTDLGAYWLAGARLNAGLPLYTAAQIGDPDWYGYPPLVALVFRPLALLPFEFVSLGYCWLVGAGLAVLVHRLVTLESGGRWAFVLAGLASYPILFGLMVGQWELLNVVLIGLGGPVGLAIAAHAKVVPALIALGYVAERDWSQLRRFVAIATGLGVAQLVLAPAETVAFLSLDRYGRSDGLWYVFDASVLRIAGPVAYLAVAGFLLALTLRYGRAFGVLLSIAIAPRVLAYQLSVLAVIPLVRHSGADRPRSVESVGAGGDGSTWGPRTLAAGERLTRR